MATAAARDRVVASGEVKARVLSMAAPLQLYHPFCVVRPELTGQC